MLRCAFRLSRFWRPQQFWLRHQRRPRRTTRIIRSACRSTAERGTTSPAVTLRWPSALNRHRAARPNASSIHISGARNCLRDHTIGGIAMSIEVHNDQLLFERKSEGTRSRMPPPQESRQHPARRDPASVRYTDLEAYPLAENECREQPKTGNRDCEKETVGDEFIKRPHDRTPLFDQFIRTFSDKSLKARRTDVSRLTFGTEIPVAQVAPLHRTPSGNNSWREPCRTGML